MSLLSSYLLGTSRKFGVIFLYSFILSIAFTTENFAQNYIVDAYKEVLPEAFYKSFIEKESLIKESVDSIHRLKTYYQLGRSSLSQNEELNIEYCAEVLKYAKALNQDSIYNRGLIMAALPHINRAEFEIADSLIAIAVDYWTENDHIPNLAHALKISGYSQRANGNYVKALENHIRSYRLQLTYDDISNMGDIYNRIGMTYMGIGDYDAALQFFEEYFSVDSEERSYIRWLPPLMSNAANCYKEIGKDSLYYDYYEKSSLAYLKSSGYKSRRRAYKMKSVIAKGRNKLDSALIYLDSSLYYSELFGSAHLNGFLYIAKHDMLKEIGNNRSANSNLWIAKRISDKSNNLKLKRMTYSALAQYYKEENDYKNALHYREKLDSLRGQTFSEDIASEIRKLGVSFQQEESDEEISILKEQNRLKQENIDKEAKIKKFLYGLALASIMVLALVIILLRQRTSTANSLKSKNEIITRSLRINENLLKEVHHRVKNNLQVVSSLLFLQSRYIDDPAAQEALQNGRDRVKAMSLLHQKLYQNEDIQSIRIKDYFEELSQNLFSTHKIDNQDIELVTDISDVVLNVDVVIPMGLLANELISNALKHAFVGKEKGVISLDITLKENDKIEMIVSDDGIGIPSINMKDNNNSLGMKLVSSFAQKLKAKIDIENAKGTKITLSFDPSVVVIEKV